MTFQYEKLAQPDRQIRTAYLQPGAFQDRIIVHFAPRNLEDAIPTYQALSYVWGSGWSLTHAQVSSDQRSGTMPITQNLDSALRHLRSESKPRSLWIDALCINQSDDEEKDVQVMNMGSIFKTASSVIAWLGPEESNSNVALRLLGEMGRDLEVDWNTDVLTLRPRRGTRKLTRSEELERQRKINSIEDGTLPWPPNEISSIFSLLTRSYFRRAWIVQEVRLAKHVVFQCGHTILAEDSFWKTVLLLCKSTLSTSSGIDTKIWYEVFRRLWFLIHLRAGKILVSIFRLRYSFGHLQCCDPRDKIYSILGMLDEWGQGLKIVPAYLITPEAVYRDVMQRVCIMSSSLDLLDEVDLESTELEVPSWVPNWSTPLNSSGLWLRWSACAWVAARPTFDEVGSKCTVSGVCVGSIADTGETSDGTYGWEELFDFLRASFITKDLNGEYLTGESLLQAYCRVLVSDCLQHSGRPPQQTMPELEQGLSVLRKLCSNEYRQGALNNDLARSRPYFLLVNASSRGRRLFTTKNGYIGLAPASTQNGDVLCVLMGCKFPVILRPTGNNTYLVVGPCYAHGLMHGEAVYHNKYASEKGFRVIERDGGIAMFDAENDTCYYDGKEMLEAAGLEVESTREDPIMYFVAPESLRAAGVQVRDFVLV